ncbi:MAG: hypothetical protein RJQ00_09225 [Vicingaceae bacterium]
MTKFTSTVVLLFSFTILFSCQEEELTPNEDAAKSQQAGITIHNNGGNIDPNGGGNGGNGGGSSVDEYFSAEVDGVLKTGNNPFFQSAFGIDQINSSSSSVTDLFQINILGTLEVGTINNPTINYVKTQTNTYESINGQLVLDEVTTELIKGTFYCDVVNSFSNDTLIVTNGRFKVER